MKENRMAQGHAAGNTRDVNSKKVFRDPILCSQFLRDNVNIPVLKNIHPEDIEDVTERYQTYLGVEFQSDTVKKIRIRDDGKEREETLYLISLIEHKSDVDYNVAMQILKYMICIWDVYGKEQERNKPGVTKRKYFKYPPILPVVYYEGAGSWTADMHFRDRIYTADTYDDYLPDFTYKVVRNYDYTNEELLARGDEISLIMMLNKIQNAEEFRELCEFPPDEMNQILENTSPSIRGTIGDVVYSLMMKMRIPVEEANQYAEMVEEGRMGYLFENFDFNMPEDEHEAWIKHIKERAKVLRAEKEARIAEEKAEAAKQKAEEAEQKAEEAEQKAEEAEQKAEEAEQKAIKSIISLSKRLKGTKEGAMSELMEGYGLSAPEAEKYVEHYW
ncbi:MAG: Rpn family recombination-promoting nuclease/putative transposase [Clostridiales bacterium]|nr:Rpn family recombination-promoting nuclease/putative transposase [Clostridiales bacterium]